MILTGILGQDCWIEAYQTNLYTDWSAIATITHNQDYIFPHPVLRLTARIMFPSKDFEGDRYGFEMNPEIFVDNAHGNYNIFAQLTTLTDGEVYYVGENDKYYKIDTIRIEPDVWYEYVLVVDMNTRQYISASIGENEWTTEDFKSRFTIRENNGAGERQSFMGFWASNKMGNGRDVYVDSYKVEIAR